jgi:hypothetical protein
MPTPAACQMSMTGNNGDPIGVMLAPVSGSTSMAFPKIHVLKLLSGPGEQP